MSIQFNPAHPVLPQQTKYPAGTSLTGWQRFVTILEEAALIQKMPAADYCRRVWVFQYGTKPADPVFMEHCRQAADFYKSFCAWHRCS